MKKLFGRLSAFVIAAMLVLAPMAGAFADDANEAVLNACNSVVRFYCASSATGGAQTGSGFAVGKAGQPVELIITNSHVVLDDNGNVCDDIRVVLENINMVESTYTGTVVYLDSNVDFAIVQIAPTTLRVPITLLSASSVKRTQTVFALGFPGVADSIDDEGDSLPSTVEDITITKGTISKTKATIDGANFIQTDTVINGGNSGGPLVTEHGYCVGINTFSAIQGEGTYGAMYIDYVTAILDQNGIPYEYATGAEPPASGDTPSAPSTGGDTPAATTPSDEGSLAWLWILLGVLVVGGGVAVIIVVSVNGKKNGGSAAGQSAPAPSGPSRSFAISGDTGYFSGNTFNVPPSGSVTVGRNATLCNLVFPPDTPGISSRHCAIAARGDKLLLTDLGSTYGTFLADGTRLAPNAPVALDAGQRFYLGDPGNTFTVR